MTVTSWERTQKKTHVCNITYTDFFLALFEYINVCIGFQVFFTHASRRKKMLKKKTNIDHTVKKISIGVRISKIAGETKTDTLSSS